MTLNDIIELKKRLEKCEIVSNYSFPDNGRGGYDMTITFKNKKGKKQTEVYTDWLFEFDTIKILYDEWDETREVKNTPEAVRFLDMQDKCAYKRNDDDTPLKVSEEHQKIEIEI